MTNQKELETMKPGGALFGRIVGVGASAVVLAAAFFASPASAHVTVHPTSLPAGSSDVELTFRVPNERDNANTVKLQVYLPTNLPLLTVDVLPVPGWTSQVNTTNLTTPVKTDDGTVSQVVSDITWTATAGGIAPGQYQDFDIAAGQVPDKAGSADFKSLQTYSSGEVVRWIEVASPQDPDPDSPAPELTLTAPTKTPIAAVSGDVQTSADDSQGLAIAALIVGGLSLCGVIFLLVSSSRRRPKDLAVASPQAVTPAVDDDA